MSNVKEPQEVPAELITLVEDLKKFIHTQKTIREENCCQKFSIEPIVQVETEMDEIHSGLHKIEVDMQRCGKMVESLKEETRELLSNAEMAFRLVKSDAAAIRRGIYNSPDAHLHNIPSVDKYFRMMITKFENNLKMYSNQVDDLVNHLENLNKPHNPEELFLIMKKQHEIMVGLASHIYEIKEKIS
ncbi:nucleoporin p58/p45-like [Brevipalpus obovatus]|uniref:nucleoporin p58/p45-like n=1 Tax=Brevipalpus obovatus TaxID=246614 RepID=UPI003D9E4796